MISASLTTQIASWRATELSRLVCGDALAAPWSESELDAAIVADHGYHRASRAVRWFAPLRASVARAFRASVARSRSEHARESSFASVSSARRDRVVSSARARAARPAGSCRARACVRARCVGSWRS